MRSKKTAEKETSTARTLEHFFPVSDSAKLGLGTLRDACIEVGIHLIEFNLDHICSFKVFLFCFVFFS